MHEEAKTKKQLIEDLRELRKRVARLESDQKKLYQDKIAFQSQSLDDLILPLNLDGFESNVSENRALRHKLHRIMLEQKIILDTANVAISMIRDRKHVWVNRKTEEMFQYPKEELINETTRKLFPSQEAYERLGKEAYTALAEGKTYETIQELIRRDGSHIWVKYNGRAIDPPDLSIGTIWILEDFTERKRMEETLQQSREDLEHRVVERTETLMRLNEDLHREIAERKRAEDALRGQESTLRGILNATTESIFQFNRDGVILMANETAAKRLGARVEEVIGKHFSRFMTAELAQSRQVPIQEVLDCKMPVMYEDERSGILFGHTFYPVLDVDGCVTSIVSYSRDITERKRASRELKTALIKYRTLFESFPHGITVSDPEGNIIEINREAERILGLPTSEHLQRDIAGQQWRIVRPDGSPMPTEEFASVRALKEQRIISAVEMGVIKSSGETAWLSVTAAPIPLPDYGVVITYSDIGAQRKAEDNLRSSLEEKTALLKEVHHRVKNNLQIVDSLLGLQSARTSNEQVLDVLQDTRNRVRSMALLHETLYHSGNLACIHFATYLKNLCRQLLLAYSSTVGRIQMKYHIARIGLPLEQAVPCGLIVSELVSNALKHGFPKDRTGCIFVEVIHDKEGNLVLCVRDDGVGLSHGFNPENASRLGLQLVTGLAGQLGGQLESKNQQGMGAAFRVAFPLPRDMQPEGSS